MPPFPPLHSSSLAVVAPPILSFASSLVDLCLCVFGGVCARRLGSGQHAVSGPRFVRLLSVRVRAGVFFVCVPAPGRPPKKISESQQGPIWCSVLRRPTDLLSTKNRTPYWASFAVWVGISVFCSRAFDYFFWLGFPLTSFGLLLCHLAFIVAGLLRRMQSCAIVEQSRSEVGSVLPPAEAAIRFCLLARLARSWPATSTSWCLPCRTDPLPSLVTFLSRSRMPAREL